MAHRFPLVLATLAFATSVMAATIDVPPDGPEQMPVLYVHGYSDDGSGWARDSLYLIEQQKESLSQKYIRHYIYGPQNSPSQIFTLAGMPNWAVQWWSTNLNGNYADPFSTEEEGYAFLQSAEELLDGTNWVTGTWTTQNRPIPSAMEVLTTKDFNLLNLAIWASIGEGVVVVPQWQTLLQFLNKELARYAMAAELLITNTYNDSGRIDPRAQNFLDLLRRERRPGGKVADWRQVNVITHSMGSLVSRAMLHKAGEASREDSEFVANVIYNAPPFAGSTMGHLGQMYFGSETFTSAQFADPIFNKMYTEAFGSVFGAITTARAFYNMNMQLLLRPLGFDIIPFTETMPEWARVVVDALDEVPLGENVTPAQLANTPVGDAIAGAMQLVRPLAGALTGMAGSPGIADLTPAGGVFHIENYPQNPDVKQFVTIGKLGFKIHLFPTDLQATANNPDLITDPASLVGGFDDTAVAVGSAKLLTQTDNFGPRMTLLPSSVGDEFNQNHDEMLYSDVRTIAPVWLETFLTAPTTLRLNGNVSTINSGARSFLVDGASTFAFQSNPLTRTVSLPPLPFLPFFEVTTVATAVMHEYRVVPADSGAPSAWVELAPGQTVGFATLVQTHSLSNKPFYLEWRSRNNKGGREMIRSARLVVIGEAPQVVDTLFHTPNPAEVLRNSRNSLLALKAVRGPAVRKIPQFEAGQLPILNAILDKPESDWVVRNPATKAFTAIFDTRGDVEYVWNDESFTNPTRRNGQNGLLVSLAGLSEGPHTLLFETIQTTQTGEGPIIKRSPRQRVRILVDNTAPSVQFLGDVNHPIGRVVGPRTPLRFTVEDVGSNGGTGTMAVPGLPAGVVHENESFSLGETNLKQQMEAAGIVGGFVNMNVTARDAVTNTRNVTVQVYYDIAAPQITLVELAGALPAGANTYNTVQEQLQIAVNVSDAGSGLRPPIVEVGTASAGTHGVTEPLELGGMPSHPTSFGGTIRLSPGENAIIITARDFGDNIGRLMLTVHRNPALTDQFPVDLLSPRLTNSTPFFDSNGVVVLRSAGDVLEPTSDYHGDTFLFTSIGNAFIGGDTNSGSTTNNDNNRIRDVFMWREGKITRISTSATGAQANGLSDSPAISGNGRYAVFRSTATNLVPGATTSNVSNLYLKDLETGQIGIISRTSANAFANVAGTVSFRKNAMTFSGRYVFFHSGGTNHVSGLTDSNGARDVFMVDLDSDANGNFFDGTYVTKAISTNIANATQTANAQSFNPRIGSDGKHVVFRSGATNIHADTASTSVGNTNAIRMDFAGADATGNLNTASRTVYPVNRSAAFGSTSLTSNGVSDAAINPITHETAFSTFSDVTNSGDTNGTQDVYLALGNPTSPFISWTSHSFNNTNSTGTVNASIPVALAEHEPGGDGYNKVAWVSGHNNIEPNDSNNVADLFIRINDTGSARNDLKVINWITNTQPSGAPVMDGGLTPDGRYAWWVSAQSYVSPYATNGEINLYRRRLDPISTKKLTVNLSGSGAGTVQRIAPGTATATPNVFDYPDTEKVTLTAVANVGSKFTGWTGVDKAEANVATVRTSTNRTVTATFIATVGPTSANATIQTTQDTLSPGVAPNIVGPTDTSYAVSIVSQPQSGAAFVQQNLLFYQPNPETFGNDSFQFQVTNESGQSLPAPATANVAVAKVNRPPQTTQLLFAAAESTYEPPTIPQVSDEDGGETFTFVILTQPSNGTATVQNNQLVYTPNAGFTGEDSFTYRVTDSAGNTMIGVAQIVVDNPAPLTQQIITALNRTGGIFVLSFATDAAFNYKVDYKNALADSYWTPLTTVSGTGSPAQVQDNGVIGLNSRYYRIRRLAK